MESRSQAYTIRQGGYLDIFWMSVLTSRCVVADRESQSVTKPQIPLSTKKRNLALTAATTGLHLILIELSEKPGSCIYRPQRAQGCSIILLLTFATEVKCDERSIELV